MYVPAQSREKARRSALEHVVKTFFDGSMEHAMAALLDISGVDVSTGGLDRIAHIVEEAQRRKVTARKLGMTTAGGSGDREAAAAGRLGRGMECPDDPALLLRLSPPW